ncbi:MAG: replication initiator protein A [Eubacteriales bacterium]
MPTKEKEVVYHIIGSADGYHKTPNRLYTEPYVSTLSFEAKYIYSIMLNQYEFTLKNGWCDDQGKTFILFPIEKVQSILKKGKRYSIKIVKELVDIGLITKIRQGACKPDKIYMTDISKKNILDEPHQHEINHKDTQAAFHDEYEEHHGGSPEELHEVPQRNHCGSREELHEVPQRNHCGSPEAPPYISNQNVYNKTFFFNPSFNQSADGRKEGGKEKDNENLSLAQLEFQVEEDLLREGSLPSDYCNNETKMTIAIQQMIGWKHYATYKKESNECEFDFLIMDNIASALTNMLTTKGTQTIGKRETNQTQVFSKLIRHISHYYGNPSLSEFSELIKEKAKDRASQHDIEPVKHWNKYISSLILDVLDSGNIDIVSKMYCDFDVPANLRKQEEISKNHKNNFN